VVKLLNRARERLVRLAKGTARVGKLALIKQQRYAHAKQFEAGE
jgi:transposase, IS5 family